jgi:hypothetical protein
MGIWIAASLRKKMELARRTFSGTPLSGSEPASDSGVGHDLNETQNSDINADEPSITALSNLPSPSSATSTKSTTFTHLLPPGTSRSSDRTKSSRICQCGLSRAPSNLSAFMLPCWAMDIGQKWRVGDDRRETLGRLFGGSYKGSWQRHLSMRQRKGFGAGSYDMNS